MSGSGPTSDPRISLGYCYGPGVGCCAPRRTSGRESVIPAEIDRGIFISEFSSRSHLQLSGRGVEGPRGRGIEGSRDRGIQGSKDRGGRGGGWQAQAKGRERLSGIKARDRDLYGFRKARMKGKSS
jgi:hypothetical protein